MTAEEVAAGKTQAKALVAALSDADQANPDIKAALIRLSNAFTNRLADIEAEAHRQAERERLEAEAVQQSEERARLAAEESRINEEKRALEEERRRQAQAQQALEAERKALDARRAADKAAAARPKSNITEYTEFTVIDADAVPRELCSPDEKLIRAWIKAEKLTAGDHNGIRVTTRKAVR